VAALYTRSSHRPHIPLEPPLTLRPHCPTSAPAALRPYPQGARSSAVVEGSAAVPLPADNLAHAPAKAFFIGAKGSGDLTEDQLKQVGVPLPTHNFRVESYTFRST
jgi:hypothetical protein